MADCLFCKIMAKEIPADLVRETDSIVAFRDIDPQAPTHILIVPRRHIARISDLTPEDGPVIADVLQAAREIAKDEGLTDYRLVFNCGAEAGQSVWHIHLHLLGGRAMRWPPG